MRLHHVSTEYTGRVRLRVRPFPLEVMGGEAAPRRILEQEWWLAAIQEPLAEFKPFEGDDWPTSAQLGQQQSRVHGTPTIMPVDGTKLRHPIAYARMRDERVIGVTPLPCHGDACIEATRQLFEQALGHDSAAPAQP